ncbi:hypothetical protein TYRP_015778 [Tyrophagus putrescentiae]|nr:hypothetical protein TYRP_015778 [Tyrophagus putrescentiae]
MAPFPEYQQRHYCHHHHHHHCHHLNPLQQQQQQQQQCYRPHVDTLHQSVPSLPLVTSPGFPVPIIGVHITQNYTSSFVIKFNLIPPNPKSNNAK